MRKKYYELGYGGLGMFWVGVGIAIALFFLLPSKFHKPIYTSGPGGYQYCRDLINDPNAPTITAPSYKGNQVFEDKPRQYRLIKKYVPIVPYIYGEQYNIGDWEHTIYSYKGHYIDEKTQQRFIMRFPNGAGGRSYDFPTTINPGLGNSIVFADYGLMLLFYADSNDQPIELKIKTPAGELTVLVVDIYKAVDAPAFPDWVLQCIDKVIPEGTELAYTTEYELYYPKQNWSPIKAEEQLGYFLPKINPYLSRGWWVPHCKPAIYLYPEKETEVNVKVNIPNGSLLYTDPLYPSDGWNVLAKSNGEIHYHGNLADSKGSTNYPSGIFPYLYYEARIEDLAIDKPNEGFVVAYDKLPVFYSEILPRLGLSSTETQQFKQYWEKALPKSPYYFVGIVPKSNLDAIEPLTITPQQDTTIRVSLYFEALNEFKITQSPIIQTPHRSGFTVVEWGGMVKTDKEHPFTCSQ